MKNLAGNNVSIFLFRFVLRKKGISFVLNESIAEDMYPEIESQVQPLMQACCDTLLRYRHLCNKEKIMDGNILIDGCFEVMLSPGLGIHFADSEKSNLFKDANEIAILLIEVMDRRSKESKNGIYNDPQPVITKIQGTQSINDGLEELGRKREKEMPVSGYNRSNLSRLKPDGLPQDVIAKKGYDHRGHCYAFEHLKLGDLGKIILVEINNGARIEADLYNVNSGELSLKKKIFEEIIYIVEKALK